MVDNEGAEAGPDQARRDGTGGGWLVGHGSRLRQLLGGIPGAAYAEDQLEQAEGAVLRELKTRLDRLEPQTRRPASSSAANGGEADGNAQIEPGAESAADTLARLMDESMTQSREQAENAVYRRLLNALLPDEARIFAALSDGQPHPLVHAGHGPPVGPLTHRLATNLCSIGRSAQVRSVDHTPHYIEHMRSLGLVRIGPGMRDLDVKYQVIENDKPVRELVADIEKESGKHVRFSRQTLRISALGRQLWEACQVGLDENLLGWEDA